MTEPNKKPFDHGWLYPPRKGSTYITLPNPCEHRSIIAYDQQKLNLTWLVAPEMDGGLSKLPDAVAVAINTKMAADLRNALRQMPKAFLAWLSKTDCADFTIFAHSPPDFYDTLVRRANEAQARLVARDESNIITVDFGRKKA